MEHSGHHFIAIFGGAVAGSEAAYQLAIRGFRVVVFDQNLLPYGKIEDGLPKWHDKLRDKEEAKINHRLSLPNIRFVPGVRLGRDLDFKDVVENWGFTAVLVATGAWKDRSLPIEGIDSYINKGLYYQNPLVYWFNHYHEPDYSGQQFEIKDEVIVVGGGLASLDVVKILMIETVQKALLAKGHSVDMFTLDRGIKRVLDDLGLTLADLNLKGCTLFYRRRDIDMPLSPMPADTPEKQLKNQAVSKKILDNFLNKYLFRFEPNQMPIDKIVENGRLAGLVFQKTKVEDGKVVPVPNSTREYKSPLVISSIGSLPEVIDGIPIDGQVFKIADFKTCRIEGYPHVFALGNAVTGRGNINESMRHGREISLEVVDSQLDWLEEDFKILLRNTESVIDEEVDQIIDRIKQLKPMPDEVIRTILDRTKKLQEKVGYDGDFLEWIVEKTPPRLEDLIKEGQE